MNSVPISCHVTLKRNKCKHDLLGQKFNVSHVNDSFNGWMGCKSQVLKEILNRTVTFFMYITFYTDVLYFSGPQDARLFLWRFDARKSDQNYSKGWSCQIVNFFFSSTPPTTVLYRRFLRSFEVKSSCQRSHSPEYGLFKLYIFIEYQDNMWV